MVATQIRLDLNGKKGPDLWARLGESDTRQIVMHPGYYDPEGTWVPLVIDSENINAKFRIVKPDNTFVIQDASLYLPSDPSIFVVTLPAAATQIAGLGYYDLRIGDHESGDYFLYSAGGRFIVDDDMITDEMIESVASVNGLVFPDDFMTSADLEDYATKEYVNEAIAEIPSPLHEYSTSEKIVGTWVDGKPIYEKTINIGALSKSNSWQSFNHNIANLKRIISCNGWMIDTTGGVLYMYPIPENRPNTQNGICIEVTITDINIFHNWLDNVGECYVTMTYTKTTD